MSQDQEGKECTMWMLEKSILGTENSKCEDLEEQVCRECEKNIKMPEDGSRVNNAENSRSGSLGMETWELGRAPGTL